MLSRILLNYFSAMRSYRLKTEDLKRLQDKKFRRMIRYAYENIPYYHEVLKSISRLPSDFQTIADLRHLPVMRKKDMAENLASGRITNSLVRIGYSRSTSGTTGRPLRVPYAAEYCDILLAIRMRRMKIVGIRALDKAVSLFYDDRNPSSQAYRFGESTDDLKSSNLRKIYKVLFGSFRVNVPVLRQRTIGFGPHNLRETAHKLYEIKPDVLESRPSYQRRFASILENEGLEIGPRILLTQGEHLSETCRRDLRGSFRGAEVFNVYGAQEIGPLGQECPEHGGVYLNADYFAFEVLRDGEYACSPGESGELVITSFHNQAAPLLRYKIGDHVLLGEKEKCGCGSCLPRLSAIEGRANDGLVSIDGLRIAPGRTVDYLENELGMRDFQVVQKDSYRLLVRLKPKYDSKDVSDFMLAYFRGLLGPNVELQVET